MNEQKQLYIERLAADMRSAGQENWTQGTMADLCDLAGIWGNWMDALTRKQEERVALKAAKILGVEIRHYIPA